MGIMAKKENFITWYGRGADQEYYTAGKM